MRGRCAARSAALRRVELVLELRLFAFQRPAVHDGEGGLAVLGDEPLSDAESLQSLLVLEHMAGGKDELEKARAAVKTGNDDYASHYSRAIAVRTQAVQIYGTAVAAALGAAPKLSDWGEAPPNSDAETDAAIAEFKMGLLASIRTRARERGLNSADKVADAVVDSVLSSLALSSEAVQPLVPDDSPAALVLIVRRAPPRNAPLGPNGLTHTYKHTAAERSQGADSTLLVTLVGVASRVVTKVIANRLGPAAVVALLDVEGVNPHRSERGAADALSLMHGSLRRRLVPDRVPEQKRRDAAPALPALPLPALRAGFSPASLPIVFALNKSHVASILDAFALEQRTLGAASADLELVSVFSTDASSVFRRLAERRIGSPLERGHEFDAKVVTLVYKSRAAPERSVVVGLIVVSLDDPNVSSETAYATGCWGAHLDLCDEVARGLFAVNAIVGREPVLRFSESKFATLGADMHSASSVIGGSRSVSKGADAVAGVFDQWVARDREKGAELPNAVRTTAVNDARDARLPINRGRLAMLASVLKRRAVEKGYLLSPVNGASDDDDDARIDATTSRVPIFTRGTERITLVAVDELIASLPLGLLICGLGDRLDAVLSTRG